MDRHSPLRLLEEHDEVGQADREDHDRCDRHNRTRRDTRDQARQNGDQAKDMHPVYAEVHPTADDQQEQEQTSSSGERFKFDARVVDKEGNVYLELRGYRTARLPAPIGDDLIAPMRRLVDGNSPSSDADS